MYNLPYFKAQNEKEVFDFMHQHPFITLMGVDENSQPVATHVPVLFEEREGKLFLLGHIMKLTDHHKAFNQNENVLGIFTGSHTYVSASWYKDQKQASTWNYQAVHAKGKLKFLNDNRPFGYGITAMREFNRQRGHISFWAAVKRSKHPSTFVVLFEDVADLLGLSVAFLGVFLGHLFKNPFFDGMASILIGLILTGVSILLARESRSLLMGESADKKVLENVIKIAEAEPIVLKVGPPLSMYMGSEQIVLVLMAVFDENSTTKGITDAMERIRNAIKQRHPSITKIFIEPGTG